MVLLGQHFNLPLRQLSLSNKVQVRLLQCLNVLSVSLSDHAIGNLDALIGQHLTFGALDVHL